MVKNKTNMIYDRKKAYLTHYKSYDNILQKSNSMIE